jgi:hypothetical protein
MLGRTFGACVAAGVILFAGALSGARGAGADPAEPGELTADPPTIHCLGVRWLIGGDGNHNARVAVEYRKAGEGSSASSGVLPPAAEVAPGQKVPPSDRGPREPEAPWRKALPLFRPDPEAMKNKAPAGMSLFAGSVLNLEPDTEYELRLTLTDPDNKADTVRTVKARTRGEPKAPEPVRTLHVAPGTGGGRGTAEAPFQGLAEADKAARPGDLFLVHKGVYPADFTVTASGEPARPIIWRAAGDGAAVIESAGEAGARVHRGISATEVHDVWFEGLTIRGPEYAIVAHGSQRLVVRRCLMTGVDYGLAATRNTPELTGFFIADNVIEGPCTWPRSKGIEDPRGIQVSGVGHVVCYNRVRGFSDAIDTFDSSECSDIDFYGNEISEMTDDGMEADYSQVNVRVFANRITNCFQGISEQPIYGGPVYIFRNALYNIQVETFKMHNSPSGFLLFHNTSVKQDMPWLLWTSSPVTNVVSRNNLFIGTTGDRAMDFSPPMNNCDFDYDGFGGGPFKSFAKWNNVRYDTFQDFVAKSPIEHHAVLLDPLTLFASGVKPPTDVKVQQRVEVNDLRLSLNSRAVDAGEVIPNVNDGFRGKAPDLGAYEVGEELPHYGPRPE